MCSLGHAQPQINEKAQPNNLKCIVAPHNTHKENNKEQIVQVGGKTVTAIACSISETVNQTVALR